MPEKECFKCHQVKPLDEFYKHPRMADGHLNKCKECTKRDVQRNCDDHIFEKHEYERKRGSTTKRKEQRRESQRRRRARFPEKHSARKKVRRAVASGLLVPKPCEVCGNCQVQAHHDDYSKPLDVRWLCFVHHREVHGQRVLVVDVMAPAFKAA